MVFTSDIYKDIHLNYERLSDTERKVVDFILKSDDVDKLKLKDIKDVLYVSNATIIRACKKLNHPTFNSLKSAFVKSEKEKSTYPLEVDFSYILDGIKKETLATLELIDEKNVDQICNCLIEARRIFCVGLDGSSQVASEFNRKLKSMDIWTNNYSEQSLLDCIPYISTDQDVVIIFSLSGQIDDINENMLKVKRKGTTIIAVTNVTANKLKLISTHVLVTYNDPDDRRTLYSRLMLHALSTVIYEKLRTKVPSFE